MTVRLDAVSARARTLLLCLLLGAAPGSDAREEAGTEVSGSTAKAAFLSKFAGYVEWPAGVIASPEAPIVIGVVESADVASDLERIAPGRSVDGHPLALKRVGEGDSLRGLAIVFVGAAAAERIPAIVRAAQRDNVLVVTESEGALEQGSAINFVPAGDRIAFEVSLEAAERTGHRISARLLALARRVVGRAAS